MEYILAFRNGIKYSIWLATWYNANLWIKWPANILVWWLNITDQLSVTVLMLYVSRKPGLMWWINWLELFWPSASCYLVGAMMMINAMWFLFLDGFIYDLEYWCVTLKDKTQLALIQSCNNPRRANTNAKDKYKMLIQLQMQSKWSCKCKYK